MIKLTRLHRNFLLLTLMVAITAINGCSSMSGARYDSMIPVDYDIVHKQMKTVSIDVRGGVEPNKSLRPMISNEEFTKAIVDAVTRSQAFSQVVPESRADYILIVTIISLEQPTAGRRRPDGIQTGKLFRLCSGEGKRLEIGGGMLISLSM